MFDHFGQRLKRDLKQLVDRRIEASENLSGSTLRVTRILLGSREFLSFLTFSPLGLTSMSFHTRDKDMPYGLEGPYLRLWWVSLITNPQNAMLVNNTSSPNSIPIATRKLIMKKLARAFAEDTQSLAVSISTSTGIVGQVAARVIRHSKFNDDISHNVWP